MPSVPYQGLHQGTRQKAIMAEGLMRFAILVLLLVPTMAAGQVRGDSIRVRLNDGQQLEGRLLSLDSTAIGVRWQLDTHTFPLNALNRFEVWDRKSLAYEIGWRAIVGAVGMWMASREFLWGDSARPIMGSVAGDVAVGVAAGAVIGFALLRKSPDEWKEIRVHGSPSGIGLSLAVAWPQPARRACTWVKEHGDWTIAGTTPRYRNRSSHHYYTPTRHAALGGFGWQRKGAVSRPSLFSSYHPVILAVPLPHPWTACSGRHSC